MAEGSSLFTILLGGALGVGALVAFLIARNKLRSGFLLFIVTLALGYRTVAITRNLRVIPAELILCLLPLLLAVRKRSPGGRRSEVGLPVWLWLFFPFWLLAWMPKLDHEIPWDIRFAEFRDFLLLVPLLLVAPAVLRERGGWRAVILTFSGVGIWVAGVGVLEHLFPGIMGSLPGFTIKKAELVADDGFHRAGFSFYGSPIGIFICGMALPFSLVAWQWWRSPGARVAIVGGAIVQLMGLYIAGWRSMWLVLVMQVALYSLLKKRLRTGVLIFGLAAVGFLALPGAARERVKSLELLLSGKPSETDTSGMKRWSRATEAFQAALEEPMGWGWGAAGWVHSDFLQVAANQGVAAGLLLLSAYVLTLGRLALRVRGRRLSDEAAAVGIPLLLAFVAVGAILLFEGVQATPQTILPVWLTWALVEAWLSQTAPARPRALTRRRVSHRPLQTANLAVQSR
jgi:hypothetical protein